MSLEGGKVLCYGEDGEIEKILQPTEKIFTIGYYMSCDVIHEHPEVKGIHCEIACDSFGRINVKNYCETHPIIVNGETVAGTRPLLTGSTIEVVGKQFRWEYNSPTKEEDTTQTTPDAKAAKVQQAPTSEPSAPACRTVQKRLTVHSFSYGLNSNREEDMENPSECSIIQPLQMNASRQIIENQSSANLLDISLINKENCTPKRRLSICSQSEIVVTSYSPRAGINTQKGFVCVTPTKKTPKSLYATPRSALSEYNQSTDSMDFTTPKAATPKLTSRSMYLIDLTTPLKPLTTSIKKTPLLKSVLKSSVKNSTKTTAKKATFTGGTNFQGRKIALETPAKKSVSATPKRLQQTKQQSAEAESNSIILDYIIEQYTVSSTSINVDSSIAEDSSVIEISSDGTPSRLKEKKQPKTPQLLARKAIITSARKAKTAEKDFSKKIKNNIERISENLSTIGNIRGISNRRSSLPAISAIPGRQSLLPQSNTKSLKSTATPQRTPTTSTPFKSRKSLLTMIQSTPLKTPQKTNLAGSFRRNSCIISNQATPKVAAKTPRKSIMKSQEIKTPKKCNSSVLSIDNFDKSFNQIKENDEDTLNATFTVDEEEEQNDGNKTGSKSAISESKPMKQIGHYLITEAVEEEKFQIQAVIKEEIPVSDNKSKLEKATDNKKNQSPEPTPRKIRRSASFTIESPKELQAPKNVITRSMRKQIAEDTPVETLTDLEGLKELLKTPRGLNRTPVFVGLKDHLKTLKMEQSGNKGEIKTPIKIQKVLGVKLGFNTPKVTREENLLGVKELLKTPKIVESSEDSFIGIKEIMKTPKTLNSKTSGYFENNPISKMEDTLSSKKNEVEPNLRRSASFTIKTPIETQTSDVLESEKSFTKIEKSDILNTPVAGTIGSKLKRSSTFNIETPKKLEIVALKVDAEVQKNDTPNKSDIPGALTSTGKKALQRTSTIYKLKTQTNLQTPDKTLVVEDLKEVQNIKIPENAGIQSTPTSGKEHTQRQLQRSSKMNTPTNLLTPKKTIAFKDDAKDQKEKTPENAHISNNPVLGHESIPKKLRRSSISKTPTNLLTRKVSVALKGNEEAENVDTTVGQSTIAETETLINQETTETSIALENNAETESGAISEQSKIPNIPLTAFKPVLRKICESTISKTKTSINQQTLETAIPLEDDVEAQKTEIPVNADLSSALVGQGQSELQKSPIIKTELPTNLQSAEISCVLDIDAENQNCETSEHSDYTKLLKDVAVVKTAIHTSADAKRHSFMVVGQAVELFNKKENRRHTIGNLVKKSLSDPTNDDNLLKTELATSSKNFNNFEECFTGKLFLTTRTPKTLPSDDNMKLEDNKEDKNKSFNSPKTPKAEPGKLFKSATFIIDSPKRSNIANSSAQKELTYSESAYTLADNVKHSEQLLKTPENVNRTPDLKEAQKLLKTPLITPKPLGMKELFNTPKPLQDVNFVGVKELMKTPKIVKDSEDNYHGLNDLLQTPKHSVIQEETPSKSFKDDATSELADYETLLIEDESYPPSPTASHVEDETSLQVEDRTSQGEYERVLQRKYRSYPTTPIVEAKNNSTRYRKSADFFTETDEDVWSTESVKAMDKFEQEQMEDCISSDTATYNYSTSSIVELKNRLSKTRQSVGFYIEETEEDLCSTQSLGSSIGECSQDQMEEYESSDTATDIPSRELLKTPNNMHITSKSPEKEHLLDVKDPFSASKDLEKTTNYIEVKELLNTPKDESSKYIREFGLRDLMKTPAKTPNPVKIKELFNTPKLEKEENFVGVKELLKEPKNIDQTVIMLGVKELLNTPQNESEEIRELGLKKLMKTPAKTPKPVKIKELFQSPKPEKNDNFVGVKELMNSPKNLDETTIFVGVKELIKTPKNVKSPRLLGIKEIFNSPKTVKEERLEGIKELMKTPENLKAADIINLIGVKEILKTPKNDANTEDLLGLPEMFSTPHHRLINKKDIETQVAEFHDQEIDQISRSPKNLSHIAFKTPSAKMVMIFGTPQSVNINTEKSNTSVGPPPVYDLKENMEEIQEIFPTDVIETEESEALSTEDSFDKLVGIRPMIRKSYGRSSMVHKESSFIGLFDEVKEAEQPETDVVECGENESLSHSSEEIDENSRDVDDNATVFSMSGIKALEREEEESEEIEIQKNCEVKDLVENIQIAETDVVSDVISIEKESEATNSTESLGRQQNVESPKKQRLDDTVPLQTKTRKGRKRNDTLDEFKKDVVVQFNGDDHFNKESEISENIPKVKATRGGTRKRKVSVNDTDKEKTAHENPKNNLSDAPQTKRVTRNKRNIKTQIPDELKSKPIDEDHSHATVEIPRRGRKHVRTSAKVVEEVIEVGKSNQEDPIELKDEEDIKLPGEHVLMSTLNADKNKEQDDDNKDTISSNLSSSDDTNNSFVLPIFVKTRGQRNAVKGSTKTKSNPMQKRKSDSESKESVVPLKKMVRKRGVDLKEDESQQANLEIEAVIEKTRHKANNALEQQDVTKTDVKRETIPPSEGNTAKDKVENVMIHAEDFNEKTGSGSSQEETAKGETENISEDTDNLNTKAKVETTPPRRGRAKRKADNNLIITELGSSSTESEAPPVRRGRPRRNADKIEPKEQNPEHKPQHTPSRRGGSRRKVESVVEQSQQSNDNPKAERSPTHQKNPKSNSSNLLNMSTDELSPVKPAGLKTPSEEKENVSTPKSQLKNTNPLEFKTPMSAAPRARRVLRSNSTSVQNTILTPVLQEHNKQEIIAIDDSIGRIDNSLSAAASTRTRGRRRLNSTKDEVEISETEVDKLETSISGPPATKSGRTRGRPRMNSTKDEVQILNESETSENALPVRTRGRKRINSAKDEKQLVDVNIEQPETSGRIRGRKKVNIEKVEIKSLGIEIEQPEESEIVPAATSITTRTRGRKKVNSTKEEVEIPDVDQSNAPENVPQAVTSVRGRAKGRINSTKEEKLAVDPNIEKAETTEETPTIAAPERKRGRPRINSIMKEVQTIDTEDTEKIPSGRTRGRRNNANSAKEEVQIVDSNEEQTKEGLISTRTRTTRRKKAS